MEAENVAASLSSFSLMVMAGRSEERRTRNKQLRLLWRVWRTNNIFEVKWIESINGARRIKKVDPRPQEFPFAFFLSYYYVKEFNSKK